MKKLSFNTTYIALGVLVIGYLISAGRFFWMQGTGQLGGGTDDLKIVRVAHWQLEPGFRDALNWAMAEYNALPHVQQAGVRVEQKAVTERVYNQFMNVHLISGTAPDIAASGMTRLIEGNAIARFYTPLGNLVTKPNPYNQQPYLRDDLPEQLETFLATASWRDTFVDGMRGGYNVELDDYYAVPIASFGDLRFFYNATLLRSAKDTILAAQAAPSPPTWLTDSFLRETENGIEGYLLPSEELAVWLGNDEVPQTLGQLLLFCEAVRAYGRETGRPTLVPIAGSNYFDPGRWYSRIFHSQLRDEVEKDPSTVSLVDMEAVAALGAGRWSWETPAIREMLGFSRLLATFYPTGYLGLDREQAQRRFVLGEAACILGGGFDAAGIILGAANRDRPEDRFEVLISPAPMPAKGERWAEYLPSDVSNAVGRVGVPLSINKATPHFNWALDFLHFVTSHTVNEEFTRRAKWLPATTGAEPVEQLKPFIPITDGISPDWVFDPVNFALGFGNRYRGNSQLYISGQSTFAQFQASMKEYVDNPQVGLRSFWTRHRLRVSDQARATARVLSIEDFATVNLTDGAISERYPSLLYDSLSMDEAVSMSLLWDYYYPGKPFSQN